MLPIASSYVGGGKSGSILGSYEGGKFELKITESSGPGAGVRGGVVELIVTVGSLCLLECLPSEQKSCRYININVDKPIIVTYNYNFFI